MEGASFPCQERPGFRHSLFWQSKTNATKRAQTKAQSLARLFYYYFQHSSSFATRTYNISVCNASSTLLFYALLLEPIKIQHHRLHLVIDDIRGLKKNLNTYIDYTFNLVQLRHYLIVIVKQPCRY